MFGRSGVDQIDYGVCQIRQMDDEGFEEKKRTTQYRPMKTEEELAQERRMVQFSQRGLYFVCGTIIWFQVVELEKYVMNNVGN